jgi:hypothetical protein
MSLHHRSAIGRIAAFIGLRDTGCSYQNDCSQRCVGNATDIRCGHSLDIRICVQQQVERCRRYLGARVCRWHGCWRVHSGAVQAAPRAGQLQAHRAHTSPQGMPTGGATSERPPRQTPPSAQLHHLSPQWCMPSTPWCQELQADIDLDLSAT